MDISNWRVVDDKCGYCGKQMSKSKDAKIGQGGNRKCIDCIKKDKGIDDHHKYFDIVDSPEYKRQKALWIENRTKGIDQPNFKFKKPKFRTIKGKKVRIK